MWICFNTGFVSVVQSKEDTNMFMVRSRKREWLEDTFPGRDILEWETHDYRFRILITRAEFAAFMVDYIAEELTYSNFKDTVDDDELHDFYVSIWGAGMSIQRRDINKKLRK